MEKGLEEYESNSEVVFLEIMRKYDLKRQSYELTLDHSSCPNQNANWQFPDKTGSFPTRTRKMRSTFLYGEKLSGQISTETWKLG